MRLIHLPLRQPAFVDQIDWEALSPAEGQRLREFGICEGASIVPGFWAAVRWHAELAA